MQLIPNALILSDMYGFKDEHEKDDGYLFKTADFFERFGFITKIYSSSKLGKINFENGASKNIHDLFISYGIRNSLWSLGFAGQTIFDIGIGFSIGGTILWRGYQEGKLSFKRLICISSTRLRNEIEKIDIPTLTIFGEKDSYAPTLEKIQSLGANYRIMPEFDHDFYRETKYLTKIFQDSQIILFLKELCLKNV